MGRAPLYEREGEDPRWRRPPEDLACEGCPGGWYRSAFVESLLPYYRRRDGKGNRVSNPNLDSCGDPFVVACILAMEAHEEASLAEFYRVSEEAR